MDAIWGTIAVFCLCPLLGGLPLINGIIRLCGGESLRHQGTGNISVSAAFYHGGRVAGILAVLSEASKGFLAVGVARYFFPTEPAWEILALIALIMGRYWLGKGAGVTNVSWGLLLHDPLATVVIGVMMGITFTLVRERRLGQWVGLGVMVLFLSLRQAQDTAYGVMVLVLGGTLAMILQRIPDDLDLPEAQAKPQTRRLFRFFQGGSNVPTLRDRVKPSQVGNKAATLAQLMQWGYTVPEGWIALPGDDLQAILKAAHPSPDAPLIARSSAIGEDTLDASAAGQYLSIGNITDAAQLEAAIIACQQAYHHPRAVQYRQRHGQKDKPLAILVQRQVQSRYAGVVFSRDPIEQYRQGVVIEAIAGSPQAVVSGEQNPERYLIYDLDAETSSLTGTGAVPPEVLYQVARLSREIEARYHGIPQDLEWCHDGETLWILQSRPITTLSPIWSRKIAAEVIPGVICPLTWSINQPLTCGVWGEIFTDILGRDRATDLDFQATATLHFSHAYFNASLLGTIFRRMGLPAESLEFLTRGAKMSRPPLPATLRTIPGLWRLLQREWQLPRQFRQEEQQWVQPLLEELTPHIARLSEEELAMRIERILSALRRVTAYQILVPLSVALRQAILKVRDPELDTTVLPEVAALSALLKLANQSRHLLPMDQLGCDSCPSLFAYLAENPDGEAILEQFNQWLAEYGYLSEGATDIAQPRWQDDPHTMRELFSQCIFNAQRREQLTAQMVQPTGTLAVAAQWLQTRLNLKGRVAEVYNRLLAHLRWTFLELERRWLAAGLLNATGDIFFLRWPEIADYLEAPETRPQWTDQIAQRRQDYAQHKKLPTVPPVVYGNSPSDLLPPIAIANPGQTLHGIAVSPGWLDGTVQVLRSLQNIPPLDAQTILVVPHTDAGWSPVLAQVGGIIAEVGGSLSHGAIIARELGIPAVFDVPNVLAKLESGQRVRLNGSQGTIEILSE